MRKFQIFVLGMTVSAMVAGGAVVVTQKTAQPALSSTPSGALHPAPNDSGVVQLSMAELPPTGGKGGDSGNDYPASLRNARPDSLLDPWREYNRECTSFVAWALHSRNGFEMPFHDNASGWGPDARARGFVVNSTPEVGAVAWSTNTGGHVAWVSEIDGPTVWIEEYNHIPYAYDRRALTSSDRFSFIHFKDIPQTAPAAPAPVPAPAPAPAPTTKPVGSPAPSSSGAPATPSGGGATASPAPTTTQSGSASGVSSSPPPLTTTAPAAASSPPPTTPNTQAAPPAPVTYAEQASVHHAVPTFANHANASGQGPSIPTGAWVQIACKVYDPSIISATPDGYWYRIASSPWNSTYYAVANTFMNGDPANGPYTHNTDFSVPDC